MLSAQIDPTNIAILFGIGTVSSILYYMVQSFRNDMRIKKTGGVRAPQLTRFPLRGISDSEFRYILWKQDVS